MKHFIMVEDATAAQLLHMLEVGRRLREDRRAGKPWQAVLGGRTLAMLFEKPSLRTRVSFQQAMYELGGQAVNLMAEEVGVGKRESPADVARVLSGMVHGIMARVYEHQKLVEMAAHSTVPVINALSDVSHPCQALADVMTLQDEFGSDVTGRKFAFIGDGNNVARSLAAISARLGLRFALACPPGYELDTALFDALRSLHPNADLAVTHDPFEAVKDADAVYADTFVSMGQEQEKTARLEAFKAYQINQRLIDHAPAHAIVMHCLPAYRGVEITDDVMDGPRSRAFPQAHNRLHAQKGLLAVLMGGR